MMEIYNDDRMAGIAEEKLIDVIKIRQTIRESFYKTITSPRDKTLCIIQWMHGIHNLILLTRFYV